MGKPKMGAGKVTDLVFQGVEEEKPRTRFFDNQKDGVYKVRNSLFLMRTKDEFLPLKNPHPRKFAKMANFLS